MLWLPRVMRCILNQSYLCCVTQGCQGKKRQAQILSLLLAFLLRQCLSVLSGTYKVKVFSVTEAYTVMPWLPRVMQYILNQPYLCCTTQGCQGKKDSHNHCHCCSQFCGDFPQCNNECRYTECRNAECRYAECRYAECRYAECRYAECRGAQHIA